jgi:polyhydroxyalkanoate synthesis repressor PhaR
LQQTLRCDALRGVRLPLAPQPKALFEIFKGTRGLLECLELTRRGDALWCRSCLTDRQSGGEGCAVREPRKIMKYPNRRLYDATESRYVNFVDINRFVVEGIDFVVIEKSTRMDITRSILFQVIAAKEQEGEPLLSRDFLLEVIRGQGTPAGKILPSYLEQILNLLGSGGEYGVQATQGDAAANPANHMAHRNYERWRSLQDQIYSKLEEAERWEAELFDEREGESGPKDIVRS